MKNFLIKNKYLVSIFAFVVLNIFVSFFYLHYNPNLGNKDAYEYFRAASFLQGHIVDGTMQLDRVLTTPAFLYTSIGLTYFVHDFSTSVAIVNLIFYFLCAFAFYYLVLEIYKEERIAFLSTLLVVFNFYVIEPGNAHLADFGGWFFFILSTLYAVKYIKTYDKKFYWISIAASAVGVFFKEYGGLALVNLILLICVSEAPWKQKLKDIIMASFLVAAPILTFHMFVYFHYHYWYFMRYSLVGQSTVSETPKTFVLLFKILGWLFSVGWLAWVYGVWEEWKAQDMQRMKILLALLPVTLTFYVWPSITQRLAVMFMMWLALVAGFGLSRMKWYVLYAFLLAYILFNYNINSLITVINLPF